jgi:hypothetical protein
MDRYEIVFKEEFLLNKIHKFISHLTGNTLRLSYKIKRIVLFRGKHLFIVRTTRNTHIQGVSRRQEF